MNMSIVVLWTVLVLLQELVSSEVIVREWNKNEGSICFTEDGDQGVCRQSCVDQQSSEYKNDICNPGQSRPLYCCVKRDIARLYPTIHDICFQRMLFQEFIDRGNSLLEIERLRYASKEDYITKAIENHKKQCLEDSGHLQEDERTDFLEHCTKPPKVGGFDEFIYFRIKKRKHITAVGLFYQGQNSTYFECTGIFIHTAYLLTSASCITKAQQNGRTPNIVAATFEITPFGVASPFWIRSNILDIFIHENYTLESTGNDIAIVQADTNLLNGPQWIPNVICLWTQDWIPAENLSLSLHSYLKDVDIKHPVSCGTNTNIKMTTCKVCEFKNKVILEPDLLIGPVQYSDTAQRNVPHLVGIGSFNLTCSSNKPQLVTKISDHLGWIEKIISAEPFRFYNLQSFEV